MRAKRTFRYYLYFLLGLSLVLGISVVFFNPQSDHLYYVSSKNGNFSSFFYYWQSTLAVIYRYIGPWIPVTCLLTILLYLYGPKDWGKRKTYLAGYSLCVVVFSLSFAFFDTLLGPYLLHISKTLNLYSLTLKFGSFLCFCLWVGVFYRKQAESYYSVFLGLFQKEEKSDVEISSSDLSDDLSGVESSSLSFEELVEASNFDDLAPVEVSMESTFEEEISLESPLQKIVKSKKKLSSAASLYRDNSQTLVDQLKHKGKNKRQISSPNQEYFDDLIDKLEEKIAEFKIEGKIINILKGPVVDTFELELGKGIKVSKISSLQEDLSLALCGAPIRMVYPLKGKSTIGIEVPRNPRDFIYLDEILQSRSFKKTEQSLPIAMGKDAFGDVVTVDLAKMPHMLVAGATGAGKSVFINTLLLSLLIKRSPRELKLIMIDPKQLELAVYSELPHLALPVITEPKRAALSMMWACEEMERRYTLLKTAGVRNIKNYNEKIAAGMSPSFVEKIRANYPFKGDDFFLPLMVIVVDEFADLMMSKHGKEIEITICRLAAKARAAGIHLVVATQRPSVDVITGLIKSNFPTRVSFRVTSAVDSRTILNEMGGEKLLGNGDMLFKQGVELKRVHSAFVDEDDIEHLMESFTGLNSDYSEDAINFIEEIEETIGDSQISIGESLKGSDQDELFNEAVAIVCELRQASASMLQRRLKVGYNRAANLIDSMESKGIIGPSQGSKPREVLVSP